METTKWTSQLDANTKDFQTEFGGLTGTELNWCPAADVWSVAQNVEHLIKVNTSYFPVIDRVLKGENEIPWLGRIGFITGFLGEMILTSVLPETKRKIKTFPIWQPALSNVSPDILAAFAANQELIKEKIGKCGQALDEGTVISSPANKMVVYKLETAFDIIVAHERRHLEQARGVKKIKGTANS